jgi:hypothetical protein
VESHATSLVRLVADTDDPARTLGLIDGYMELRRKRPRDFVIPERDQFLLPVMDYINGDLTIFRMFVLAVRNDLADVCGEASFQYQSVQDFSRKLQTRYAAQKRRSRLQQAVDWAKLQMPERDYEARQQWAHRLEKRWVHERLDRLRDAKRLKGAPLTMEQKDEVLDAFWDDLDNKLAVGELPGWDELMGE